MEKVILPIQVRYRDLDTFGHVNSSVYLTYFEMARVKMFFNYFKTHPEFKFVVAKATVEYLFPVFLDDSIEIHAWVGHVGNSSFSIKYEVYCTNKNKLVAKGETIQVHIGKNGQKATLPDDFKAFIDKFVQESEK